MEDGGKPQCLIHKRRERGGGGVPDLEGERLVLSTQGSRGGKMLAPLEEIEGWDDKSVGRGGGGDSGTCMYT